MAALFSGQTVYARDIEKIMSDRSVIARNKLLGLPQLMARVVVGACERAIGDLTKAIEEVGAEIKPFEAADFRAMEVRERADDPGAAREGRAGSKEERVIRSIVVSPRAV